MRTRRQQQHTKAKRKAINWVRDTCTIHMLKWLKVNTARSTVCKITDFTQVKYTLRAFSVTVSSVCFTLFIVGSPPVWLFYSYLFFFLQILLFFRTFNSFLVSARELRKLTSQFSVCFFCCCCCTVPINRNNKKSPCVLERWAIISLVKTCRWQSLNSFHA